MIVYGLHDYSVNSNLANLSPDLKRFCTTITDWNVATTNGWYMANSAANAPLGGWMYGIVIAHDYPYTKQIVYSLFDNGIKFERIQIGGQWSSWASTGANELDSLKNTTWGNGNMNSEVMTQSASCQYQLIGNTCMVYIEGHISIPETWKNYTLATELPPIKFGYEPIGILQEQDSGRAYVIRVTKNGEMYIRSDASPMDGGWVRGSITYICNQ